VEAPAIVEPYGYAALVIGTFLEGEVALAVAGYAARGGHLSLAWVMAFGGLGVFLSDWTCFLLGRFCSRLLFARFPGLRRRIAAPLARIERDPVWFVIAFQFIPAASTVTPIALGMSRIAAWRFLVLDLIGIALWTTSFAVLGYLCGAALGVFLSDLHRYDAWAIVLVVALAAIIWRSRARRVLVDPVAGRPPTSAPGERPASE